MIEMHSAAEEYEALFGCTNCGHRAKEWVKRGLLLKELHADECPRCGCYDYMPVWDQPG